jgi:CBS domain-containing protein
MLISQILRGKGEDVFTARPEQTVAEVAAELDERRIGAVVVTDPDRRVIGIVSERDVVRVIARAGHQGLDAPIADHMTRDVIFAHPNETVDQLLSRMTDRRIRHLPVCDARERLAGIVSIGDLVKSKIAEVEAEAQGLKTYIAAG